MTQLIHRLATRYNTERDREREREREVTPLTNDKHTYRIHTTHTLAFITPLATLFRLQTTNQPLRDLNSDHHQVDITTSANFFQLAALPAHSL